MKRGYVPLILMSFLLLHACALSGSQKLTWKEFTADEGGFSVMMPGEPEEQEQSIDTAAGTMDSLLFTVSTSNATFTVGYTEFPETLVAQMSDPNALLENGYTGIIQKQQATIQSEEDIALYGHPGKEIVADTEVEGVATMLHGRFYLIGSKLYQTLIEFQSGKLTAEDIDTFLSSFEIAQSELPPTPLPAAQQTATAEAEAWQPFTSEDGAFSVDVPAEPTQDQKKHDSSFGEVEVFLYEVDMEDATYLVSYADFPAHIEQTDVETVLDSAIEEAFAALDDSDIITKRLTLEDYPGREAVAEGTLDDAETVFKGRFYLVRNRLYQLFAGGPKADVSMDRLDRFLDSFEVDIAVAETEAEAVAMGDMLLIAVGGGDNRISMLAEEGWAQPAIGTELAACATTSSAFFDNQGNGWVGCNNLLSSTNNGQTWSNVAGLSGGKRAVLDPQNRIWWLQQATFTVVDAQEGRIVQTHEAPNSTGEETFPVGAGAAVAFSPDGTLWVGGLNTNGSALVSFDGETWHAYGVVEALGLESYDYPQALLVDAAGQLLVATNTGLYVLQDNTYLAPFIPLAQAPTWPNSGIYDMIELPNGDVWVASRDGIFTWNGTDFAQIDEEQGLPGSSVYDLALDAQSRVWAATSHGLAVQNGSGGWKIALPATSGLAESRIVAIVVRGAPTLPPPDDTQAKATLSGRVLLAGELVANTDVQLCNDGGALQFEETPCENRLSSFTVQTDRDGTFRFENVPIGTFGLVILHPDGRWIRSITNIDALDAGQEYHLGEIAIGD